MTCKTNLDNFRKFLATIPLEKYREQFKDIKWVEQDLWPSLLPQESIYKYYWIEKSFVDFDNWFEDFYQEIHSDPEKSKEVKKFKKYYFDKDENGWFKKGFKARMYRTWTAMLTQLDFCYALANSLEQSKISVQMQC